MLINAAIMIFNISRRKVHLSTVANGARPEEEETRHESLNESKCTHHNLMFRKRSNKITKKKSKRFGARETNENQEDATFFKAFFFNLYRVPHHRSENVCRTFYYRTSTGVLSIVQTHFFTFREEFLQLFCLRRFLRFDFSQSLAIVFYVWRFGFDFDAF